MTPLIITLFVAGVSCLPSGLGNGGGSFHGGSGAGFVGNFGGSVNGGSVGGVNQVYNSPNTGIINGLNGQTNTGTIHGLNGQTNTGNIHGLNGQTNLIQTQCKEGEVRKIDGRCGRMIITRNLYLYTAPKVERKLGPAPIMPDPKIHYNYVFVKSPTDIGGVMPIVAPPPQQKTLVYVLNKRPGAQQQQVIEVANEPTKPEVYFVAYDNGDNPKLPGGIDLQTALRNSMQHQGTIVENNSGSGASQSGSLSGGNIHGISSDGSLGVSSVLDQFSGNVGSGIHGVNSGGIMNELQVGGIHNGLQEVGGNNDAYASGSQTISRQTPAAKSFAASPFAAILQQQPTAHVATNKMLAVPVSNTKAASFAASPVAAVLQQQPTAHVSTNRIVKMLSVPVSNTKAASFATSLAAQVAAQQPTAHVATHRTM